MSNHTMTISMLLGAAIVGAALASGGSGPIKPSEMTKEDVYVMNMIKAHHTCLSDLKLSDNACKKLSIQYASQEASN